MQVGHEHALVRAGRQHGDRGAGMTAGAYTRSLLSSTWELCMG
jgi:hypothetical protein